MRSPTSSMLRRSRLKGSERNFCCYKVTERPPVESASCWPDGVGFDHEHDGALRRAGAVHDAFWNDDSLARAEVDGAGIVFCGGGVLGIDEIDEKAAFDDVEELVLPLMIVPVIVSMD